MTADAATARDAQTLREAVAEIMRLRTELEAARLGFTGMRENFLDLMGALNRAAQARDAEIAERAQKR